MFEFVGGPLYGPPALPNTRAIESLHSEFEQSANDDTFARIRAFYHSSPRPALRYFAPGSKSIAVHVRRGDVTPKDAERWTDITDIAACVARVIEELEGAEATVHVFSDGTAEQLAGLQQYRPVLHLRDNIKTAFHHMVEADALIMAKSSLSGTAAILRSRGWNFPAHAAAGCVD